MTAKESEVIKSHLGEILETIRKLDTEFIGEKAERERRLRGDRCLLNLMKDFGNHKTGKYTFSFSRPFGTETLLVTELKIYKVHMDI